jgi:alpha-ketoglutarate-dependent taurine dioxygenase
MSTGTAQLAAKQSAETPYAPLGGAVSAEQFEDSFALIVRPIDPVLATDTAAVASWFATHKDEIAKVLLDRGALMFRDFAIRSTTDFAAAIDCYPSPPGGYAGGATPREAVQGRVFEATRSPAESTIVLHQEMSYLPRWPYKLAFYCNNAPDTGGETLISSVRRFEQAIDQRLVETIRERGLMTTRNFRNPEEDLPDAMMRTMHRSWKEAFYTEEPSKAEADIAEMGMAHSWEDDGSLTAHFCHTGFMDHPVNGKRHWFNQLISQTFTPQSMGNRWQAYIDHYGTTRPRPYEVRFGDGGLIPLEDVVALRPVLDAETVAIPYRNGDILLIDNILTFHGRNPFTGHRDVQVALLEPGVQ